MGEPRPVKLVTREEISHALRQSKSPGLAVLAAALTGLGREVAKALVKSQPYDWSAGFKSALLFAAVFWSLRFLLNVWRAPRAIAAEDRRELERSYENLQKQYQDARRELSERKREITSTGMKLVLLHQHARFLVTTGQSLHLRTQEDLDAWHESVRKFREVLSNIALTRLTNAEYAELTSAFDVYSPPPSRHHVDRVHAEVWEQLRAVSAKLTALISKYEPAAE